MSRQDLRSLRSSTKVQTYNPEEKFLRSVEFVRNVDIVALARNDPARTSELFLLGAKLVLRTNSTLRRKFSAVM